MVTGGQIAFVPGRKRGFGCHRLPNFSADLQERLARRLNLVRGTLVPDLSSLGGPIVS